MNKDICVDIIFINNYIIYKFIFNISVLKLFKNINLK
jgi:hypothetical protein